MGLFEDSVIPPNLIAYHRLLFASRLETILGVVAPSVDYLYATGAMESMLLRRVAFVSSKGLLTDLHGSWDVKDIEGVHVLQDGLQLAWLQGPQSLAFTDHASRTDTAKNDITPSRTHQFKFAGCNWGTWFGPHSNQNDFVEVRVVGHLVGTVSIYRAIDAQGWGMSIHSDLGVSERTIKCTGFLALDGRIAFGPRNRDILSTRKGAAVAQGFVDGN